MPPLRRLWVGASERTHLALDMRQLAAPHGSVDVPSNISLRRDQRRCIYMPLGQLSAPKS